ncbi:hypothetical protein B0H17DRAFT_1138538 [Mycena rosella]|uniref:Uncharacterized protein n=1 Tax=Mycena rosella TaxID=1033263 RepID=A0AAD7GC81_MYCRO|nr:hypothetical protein B0H17DRAFT_1138538 [Mycena rosella]
MRDEEAFLQREEGRIRDEGSMALAHQVFLYRMRQGRFNDGHRYRLIALAKMPGFSGSISPGVAVNKERLSESALVTSDAPDVPVGFDAAALGDDNDVDDEEESDTLEATFTGLCGGGGEREVPILMAGVMPARCRPYGRDRNDAGRLVTDARTSRVMRVMRRDGARSRNAAADGRERGVMGGQAG